jgi:putative transposase
LHDIAVAESFFQLMKREKVRRRKYRTRDEARRDVFEYIVLFYDPKRTQTNNGMLSPPITHAWHVLPAMVGFENRQHKLEKAGA